MSLRNLSESASSINLSSISTPKTTPKSKVRSSPRTGKTHVGLESITPSKDTSSVAETSERSWKAAESQTTPKGTKLADKVRCSGINSEGGPCGVPLHRTDPYRYCHNHRRQDPEFSPANVKDPQFQPELNMQYRGVQGQQVVTPPRQNRKQHISTPITNPNPEEEPWTVVEDTREVAVYCSGHKKPRKKNEKDKNELGPPCRILIFPPDRYCSYHCDQDTPESRVSSAKVEGPQLQTAHLSSEPSNPPPSYLSQRPRLSWARRVLNALIPPPHQQPTHDYISLKSSQYASTPTATQRDQEEYDYGCFCSMLCCIPRRARPSFPEAQLAAQ